MPLPSCPRSIAALAPALAVLLLAAAPVAQEPSPRIDTDRPSGRRLLRLPVEDDAFVFVVFGDRTGGPQSGLDVLAQAVEDTNLLDPDLVFTVGDLVNGYNETPQWLAQAAVFKKTMDRLEMPWFPVAGNHDIYWRGHGQRPPGEHEADYEAEFGPLWYSVRHKDCLFLALYSDEGDPETGEKNFTKPSCQRMGERQFAWLRTTLEKARDARHVFVFLHHPRWLSSYGDDWDRVHELLAKSGNVSAVFAGHIHRMRYDGVRDGIRYYTVASVGAYLQMKAPQAGYLHQFHVVTVRPNGIRVAAIPVGAVIDPEEITGEISEDADALQALRAVPTACRATGEGDAVAADGSVDALMTLRLDNPAHRPIELELIPRGERGWRFSPDHQHVLVPPGESGRTTFRLRRSASKRPFAMPRLEIRCDYLAEHSRIALPAIEQELRLPAPDFDSMAPAPQGVLVLDGRSSCLEVDSASLALPDGSLTAELWLRGDDFTGRRAALAKTQQSAFGLFCSDGVPEFLVFVDGHYARAKASKALLEPGRWHHLAGVFDGRQIRCYVDGELVAKAPAEGTRKRNRLPLFVGADPAGTGAPMSFFAGKIDEVRISSTARYAGERFSVPERHTTDADTVLLLHLDRDHGPWTPNASGHGAHAVRRGTAHCTVESRPTMR